MSAVPQRWRTQGDQDSGLLSPALDACAESLVLAENGIILRANSAFATMFGYQDGAEVHGHSLAEFIPGARVCTRQLADPVPEHKSVCGYPGCEFEGMRRDGTKVSVQACCSDFQVGERALKMINLHDISHGERRRLMRSSDQRFHAIFDAAAIGIIQCTTAGRVLESNPAMQRLLGYTRAELRDLHLRDFVHPEDLAADLDLFQELAEGKHDSYRIELRYLAKGKRTGWARITASLVRGPDRTPESVICMLEDVTECKQAERRLRESQKMEAIGRLVGGVAHDFNNLLTGIMLYCDLLRSGLEDDRLRHHAEEIHTATEHGAALIQQLLAIARQQVVEPRVLSLNTVISEMQNLLQRLIGEDIEIVTELAGNLWPVRMDPAQTQQIVLNLVLNARDAMPEGGQITLSTRNAVSNSKTQKRDSAHLIELKVTDTGCGMDTETRSRLFEPFFTTKGPGHGNGLGLATVYTIVKQADGAIDVESSPGRGTQVTIHLPGLRVDTPEQVLPIRATGEANQTVNETVLLVEDDPAVRESMSHVLSNEGYQVVQARNASEALIACRNHPGEIELLISDLVLPGMGGHQVAQRVRQLRPKVRVLFTSGYNREAIAKADRSKVLYFRKPFTGDALLRRVREVLDHGTPES